jgi:hypothetical protein
MSGRQAVGITAVSLALWAVIILTAIVTIRSIA